MFSLLMLFNFQHQIFNIYYLQILILICFIQNVKYRQYVILNKIIRTRKAYLIKNQHQIKMN